MQIYIYCKIFRAEIYYLFSGTFGYQEAVASKSRRMATGIAPNHTQVFLRNLIKKHMASEQIGIEKNTYYIQNQICFTLNPAKQTSSPAFRQNYQTLLAKL